MPKKRRPQPPALFEVDPAQAGRATRPPSARESEDFVDQVMYMIVGPYIGFPGWEGELRNHKAEITIQRMKHYQEIFRDQQSTEFEAMLYVSTASLTQPISHDWFQVYMWLFNRWQPEVAKAQGLLPDRPELNVNQKEDLARLRRWIFNQQREHLKAKRKAAENGRPAPVPEVVEQPKMF